MSKRTILLNHDDILLKIDRMAWQVYETNTKAKRIVLVGIAKKGTHINALLAQRLKAISDLEVVEEEIHIDKENQKAGTTLTNGVSFRNEVVVLVDDVLNSGKTMMYAALPILEENPRKLQTCVLANRDHKRFPIHGDFVGISLSTTLQEHISFEKDKNGQMVVYLS